jgi:hypothetical protein
MTFTQLEINGGTVEERDGWRLAVPAGRGRYTNAQIDDYAGRRRRAFPWRRGARLALEARFSHPASEMVGTAGFGFWNAPFADPAILVPWLPQTAWFFYAAPPSDLPLPHEGPGRGWFASTMDATTWPALSLAPLAPAVLLLNQVAAIRRRLWPTVRRRLGIAYAPLAAAMNVWHHYELTWTAAGCRFAVDGLPVLVTSYSPRGPLGFVSWVDNQYMVATPRGRFAWGTRPTPAGQWLEMRSLVLEPIPEPPPARL